ncbi:YraN family protein [Paenibacillus sp. NPDC058071]|uniref:YraN family protein n=1 Tax=Paenibacillus sp. NPDC058071 TaxID=3346326 RepID=UPI0036DCE650
MNEGRTDNGKREDGRKRTGRIGEDAACRALTDAGYTIVERNWRCRSGEIDAIASWDDKLVFVEIRTRREGGRYGTAAESVDIRKQRKVALLSQYYMRERRLGEVPVRFDVVAVLLGRGDEIVELKHYAGAF